MKKYYDLIVSLIKTNKRYPGCEDILDDIVNEVYAQAEIVLNEVTNEGVITSYLNKIVTTSIIKVSRQVGIKTYSNKSANETIVPISVGIHPIENRDDDMTVQSELHEETAQETEKEVEPVIVQTEVEREEDTDDNTFVSENVSEDVVQPEIQKTEPEVDKTLVDKMINGVKTEEVTPNINIIEEDTEILSVEDAPESALDISEEALPDIDISDTEEELSVETEDSFENDIVEENIPEINIADKSDDLLTESVEENSLDSDQEELLVFEESEPENDFISENYAEESTDLIQENSELGEFSLLDETSDLLEIDAESSLTLPDEKNESENIVESVETDNIEFKEPSYEYFKYSPKEYKFDYNEIASEIEELGTKYSDLNAFEVIKLKYQDRLSIDEIASKLEITHKAVLDVLNELVNIVKD